MTQGDAGSGGTSFFEPGNLGIENPLKDLPGEGF